MGENRDLTVTLETVTPLFLGGADPRGAPELRAPSFRGALRYWLRAALGGVVDDHVDAVREAEATVFGSTDEKTGGASAITVKCAPLAGRFSLTPISYSQIAGWNQASKSFNQPGTAYLLFAARKTRSEPERKGLFGTFALRLLTRPGVGNPEDAFTKAYVALWLLTHVGGIGNRSRRGAGALQAVTVQGDAQFLRDLPLSIRATTPEALVTELQQGLERIQGLLSAGGPRFPVHKPSAFDVVHPEVCKVWIINKPYDDWNKALDEVGRIYQGFRNRRPPDYKTVKDSITQRKSLSQPVQRAAFGLPIPFYYRSLGGTQATLEAEEHDRRASPLWIRVVKLANGSYATVLLWFQSEFLSSGQHLELRQDRTTVSGDAPDSSLLEIFLTQSDPVKHSSLKDKGLEVLEVSYA